MNPLKPSSYYEIIRVVLFAAAWILLMMFINRGNPYRSAATTEQVESLLNERGLVIADVTEEYLREAGKGSPILYLNKAIEASDYSMNFRLFEFKSSEFAIRAFVSTHDDMERKYFVIGSEVYSIAEQYIHVYALTSNGKYAVLSRVGNTLAIVECLEERRQESVDILKELGYYYEDAKNKPQTEKEIQKKNEKNSFNSLLSLLIFATMIPLSKILLKEVWSLACFAANSTPFEVNEMWINERMHNINGSAARRSVYYRLLVKSRDSLKFRLLSSVYTWGTALSVIFLFLAVVGCLTPGLTGFLNIARIAYPSAVLLIGAAAVIYSKSMRD